MKTDTFKCRLCERITPNSEGCDDMFPHLCDDCWCRVSEAPEAVAWRKRNEAARAENEAPR